MHTHDPALPTKYLIRVVCMVLPSTWPTFNWLDTKLKNQTLISLESGMSPYNVSAEQVCRNS